MKWLRLTPVLNPKFSNTLWFCLGGRQGGGGGTDRQIMLLSCPLLRLMTILHFV